MNARFGRCLNFGACSKADTKADIPMPLGVTDAVCPECGKPLTPAATKRPTSPLLIGVVIIVLLAIGYGILHAFFGGTQTVATAPSAASATAAGVAPIAPASQSAAPAAAEVALTLCGSNTIGSQLGPDLVRGYLASLGAPVTAAKTSATDEQLISGDVNGKPLSVSVKAHGSATAFTGLRAGDCEVGMASRRIKSGEAASLHAMGNMISPSSEHVIGLDGVAVIVNASNPLSSLTVGQLRDIFTGRISNWSGLGGSGRIAVLARDDKSGTYDTFKSLVLAKAPLTPSARRFEDSTALSAAVSADPDAIGFIGLPYVKEAKALRIASGGVPLAPTPLTVGRETYPLTRRLFLYTASTPRNPLVGKFVSFVQSDAGQQIVDRDGFVGTVTALATTKGSSQNLPSGAPSRYRQLVDNFSQTNFNFYFNTGSDLLDNKALVDVGRLVDILSVPSNRNKQVVLAGFADSTGDPQSNVALSENRANAAAKELEAQGVRVKDTVGFGQDLPIADNGTEEGREKNRRVEIFLTR